MQLLWLVALSLLLGKFVSIFKEREGPKESERFWKDRTFKGTLRKIAEQNATYLKYKIRLTKVLIVEIRVRPWSCRAISCKQQDR